MTADAKLPQRDKILLERRKTQQEIKHKDQNNYKTNTKRQKMADKRQYHNKNLHKDARQPQREANLQHCTTPVKNVAVFR